MDTSSKDAVLAAIHRRKSVRKYSAQVVQRADLLTLVKAGMAAPSGKNVQPWDFIVVTNRQVLDTLATQLPYAKMLAQVSAAIVPCGNTTKMPDPSTSLWYLDCAAATQNILLAAEAMGLAAVWTASYPYPDRMQGVAQYLQLPAHLLPFAVIPIGYAATPEPPKDKWKEENVQWKE